MKRLSFLVALVVFLLFAVPAVVASDAVPIIEATPAATTGPAAPEAALPSPTATASPSSAKLASAPPIAPPSPVPSPVPSGDAEWQSVLLKIDKKLKEIQDKPEKDTFWLDRWLSFLDNIIWKVLGFDRAEGGGLGASILTGLGIILSVMRIIYFTAQLRGRSPKHTGTVDLALVAYVIFRAY